MSGVLYIVATPIGNLDDISLRAIKTLQRVDIIAVEDTRHSKRLLAHLGIDKTLISLHDHNERARIGRLLEKLRDGKHIALISDAGTPLISDPGYQLVNAVHEAGYRVSPIPGASSIIAALSSAGLPTDQFTYCGFLSQKNTERLKRLEALRSQSGTLVLLESSHRIERLLEQLTGVFPQNRIVIAKELTKIHENILIGRASELIDLFKSDQALSKGEFVVLIDNPRIDRPEQDNAADIALLTILLSELPLNKAVRLAMKIGGGRKNHLYQLALDLEQASEAVESE